MPMHEQRKIENTFSLLFFPNENMLNTRFLFPLKYFHQNIAVTAVQKNQFLFLQNFGRKRHLNFYFKGK